MGSTTSGQQAFAPPVVMGDESIMSKKAHGTSSNPVQQQLKWGVDPKLADKICNFNRHYAERSGYFLTTSYVADARKEGEITYHDSNTGKPLFVAPRGRSFDEFVAESRSHGWPSFRDNEVVWENVRVLPDGETVSVDGTHLGHDLPDRKGNRYASLCAPARAPCPLPVLTSRPPFSACRYCINLVCIAGSPK